MIEWRGITKRGMRMMTEMLIGGERVAGTAQIPVENPFTGEVVSSVPEATPNEIERALANAERGVARMAALTADERATLLEGAAQRFEDAVEELSALTSAEEGKTLAEARVEASRLPHLLCLCAGEARRIHGETLPLDSSPTPDARGKLGLTLRVPAGVVVAISPFNYPLLLVAHKVGPALAAGNAVILKPTSLTPLTGVAFMRILLEAGYPPEAVQCVTGSGATVGRQLCEDERVRVVTFTGSREVGQQITAQAGIKRLCLELGGNCPLVVLDDADIESAAAGTAVGGFVNAGQVCTSAQRIIVDRKVYGDFLDAISPKVSAITAGDPHSPESTIGPMVTEGEAERVESVISDAVAEGAKVVVGGARDRALHQPTVVADVRPETSLFQEELFGPAIAVTRFDGLDEAIRLANATVFGLSTAIYTRDIDTAIRFAQVADAGNVHINWSPLWRTDAMPYGGFKQSGLGKEGPRYAVEEMTEAKTVVFHPRANDG